ncbi:MAG: hypothetical protein QG574_3658 [Cyanobacteriota bacterium erpe_2018_sw_21hr_WHONDRS-SW48-000092_B_bin.40]|nr:hypothetical protein [Cyanobacteriota bacterium erpe_2018_sw_21hr_WHONDRS-SW48-000092_B_bin.40]
MAKAKKASVAKKDFDPAELSPEIARRVLVALLERQPELKLAAAALADEAIKYPRMEDLAAEIEAVLGHISAGDIDINSGRTWRGYREPEEAAAEVFSEALQPYFERVEKAFRKKDDQAALIACEAVILALYRVKHSDQFSDFEEYVEDLPEETADWAARLWRSAGNEEWAADRRFHPDRTVPADFVQKYVPEWQWLLSED